MSIGEFGGRLFIGLLILIIIIFSLVYLTFRDYKKES